MLVVTAVTDCTHTWERRPEQDGREGDKPFFRYQCTTCNRWGWRTFKGTLKDVRAYKSESTQPEPKWTETNSTVRESRRERWPDTLERVDYTGLDYGPSRRWRNPGEL